MVFAIRADAGVNSGSGRNDLPGFELLDLSLRHPAGLLIGAIMPFRRSKRVLQNT